MTLEQRIPVSIEEEMKTSYIDYSMSVIVGRALPDVRDGLKPVHRRVLYTMHESGNHPNRAYRKSARIVGDVMGSYHPHGDSAIYDTIVRMAQPFSLRYMLVDGQGNFGSIDGDPAAAYRYTEVRMAKLSSELLSDIEKDTVDWAPNYDETRQEPTVLPAKVPNLLMNGSEGIAVGMATKIPPHNLTELVNGTIALIENPEITIPELMEHIPGPDFPTAGFIYGKQGIHDAYTTGRGKVIMRARITTERNKRNDRESIVITELPYQTNKAKLILDIAHLVRDKKITGISDLRDESDKDGVRVVMDLKRDEISGVIVNQLYKHTSLQNTFGVIMLTLVEGQPKVLTLKEVLEAFISFRREVVTRRVRFELAKAEARAHILEGLKIALDNLDAVIKLIRGSANPPEAKEGLMGKFGLSALQAQAILDMRLQRLTGLERDKIEAEYAELIKEIARLRAILANDQLLMAIIVDELKENQEKFGDDRRTEIVPDTGEISIEDMIVEEDMVVTVSHAGYIKRNAASLYRAQRRGGKGRIGMGTKEEDFVERLFVASTHNYFLVFTNAGRVYWLKCYTIPQAGHASRGKPIVNLLNLQDPTELVATILPVKEFEQGKNIIFATKKGLVKKTDLMAYSNPRTTGIIAINLQEGDEVLAARLSDGSQDMVLATRKGKAIRFKEESVRKVGRNSMGVKGIALGAGDQVVGLELLTEGATILTVTENGFGKRTSKDEYRAQGRGGQGVITIKASDRNGVVVGFEQAMDDENLMLITEQGMIIRMKMGDIRVIGRNTQGVRLFDIRKGDKVRCVARLAEKDNHSDDEDSEDDSEE
jgi:DNA gyrase subunit A